MSLKDKTLTRGSALTFNCATSLMAIVESNSCRRNRLWAFDQFVMWFVLIFFLLKLFLAHVFFFPIAEFTTFKGRCYAKLGQVQKCDWSESRHASASTYYMGYFCSYLLDMCNLSWWIHHIDQPQSKPMFSKWHGLYFSFFFFSVSLVLWTVRKSVIFRSVYRVYIFKWIISMFTVTCFCFTQLRKKNICGHLKSLRWK